MSDLTFVEKSKLERQFRMGSGYVLEFTNTSFAGLMADTAARDIYDDKYAVSGTSKANRLRTFWKLEPNHVVGNVVSAMLQMSRHDRGDPAACLLFEECQRIASRLLQGSAVDAIDSIVPESEEQGFETLARAVREAINKNEPEGGLDRLHTYVKKFIRTLAGKRGLQYPPDTPLHGIFGGYVRELRKAGLIESEMTDRILRSAISTLDAFNEVRNDKSLAHDNPTLGYEESLLIFNHVCSTVRFVRSIEAGSKTPASVSPESIVEDDTPF